MPSACIASLIRYSRSIGPTAALPSPPRENGVRPEPLSAMSRRRPWRSITSPSRIARPSPSCGVKPPNWCPAYACAIGVAPAGTTLPANTAAAERRIERGDVEAELRGERVVEAQQLRRRHGRGRHRRVAARQLAGVGVVEAEQLGGGSSAHRRCRGARRARRTEPPRCARSGKSVRRAPLPLIRAPRVSQPAWQRRRSREGSEASVY